MIVRALRQDHARRLEVIAQEKAERKVERAERKRNVPQSFLNSP